MQNSSALRTLPDYRVIRHAPAATALYLVAVDASAQSQIAVRAAASLARRTGASLVLIHVVAPRQSAPACSVGTGSYHDDMTEADAVLRRARRLAGGVVVQSELRLGDPATTICKRAGELRADLLIVGSCQRREAGGLLPGSVGSTVLERAPCSVVVAV